MLWGRVLFYSAEAGLWASEYPFTEELLGLKIFALESSFKWVLGATECWDLYWCNTFTQGPAQFFFFLKKYLVCHVGPEDNLESVVSPCVFQGSNWGHQDWWQTPLSEHSLQLMITFLNCLKPFNACLMPDAYPSYLICPARAKPGVWPHCQLSGGP